MKYIIIAMASLLAVKAYTQDDIKEAITQWEYDTQYRLALEITEKVLDDARQAEALYVNSFFPPDTVQKALVRAIPIYLNESIKTTEKYYAPLEDILGKELRSKSLARPRFNDYGKLKISTRPDSSEVFINARFTGYSYQLFALLKGENIIEVKSPGYQNHTDTVDVQPRQVISREIELVKEK